MEGYRTARSFCFKFIRPAGYRISLFLREAHGKSGELQRLLSKGTRQPQPQRKRPTLDHDRIEPPRGSSGPIVQFPHLVSWPVVSASALLPLSMASPEAGQQPRLGLTDFSKKLSSHLGSPFTFSPRIEQNLISCWARAFRGAEL